MEQIPSEKSEKDSWRRGADISAKSLNERPHFKTPKEDVKSRAHALEKF